jgi:hypothetical protein
MDDHLTNIPPEAAKTDNATVTPTGNPSCDEIQMKLDHRMEIYFLSALVGIVILWTFKPPDLPGDIAGAIIGGFIGWIGGKRSATRTNNSTNSPSSAA